MQLKSKTKLLNTICQTICKSIKASSIAGLSIEHDWKLTVFFIKVADLNNFNLFEATNIYRPIQLKNQTNSKQKLSPDLAPIKTSVKLVLD